MTKRLLAGIAAALAIAAPAAASRVHVDTVSTNRITSSVAAGLVDPVQGKLPSHALLTH